MSPANSCEETHLSIKNPASGHKSQLPRNTASCFTTKSLLLKYGTVLVLWQAGLSRCQLLKVSGQPAALQLHRGALLASGPLPTKPEPNTRG